MALKLALLPEDPRFERERELLSRTLHPRIPQLVDHGDWLSPGGSRPPFIAMEGVDGSEAGRPCRAPPRAKPPAP
ncbi:hypothetical protein [Hyalangium gracile]|uniref:hypothetical protein n=1 Tax=Hyalangium gracile TaxID=394092 RepID=UPI00389963A2